MTLLQYAKAHSSCKNLQAKAYYDLFHDLVLSPIFQRSVSSELTSYNPLH